MWQNHAQSEIWMQMKTVLVSNIVVKKQDAKYIFEWRGTLKLLRLYLILYCSKTQIRREIRAMSQRKKDQKPLKCLKYDCSAPLLVDAHESHTTHTHTHHTTWKKRDGVIQSVAAHQFRQYCHKMFFLWLYCHSHMARESNALRQKVEAP